MPTAPITIDKAMPGRNSSPGDDDLKLRQHCQRRKAAMENVRSGWMTDWRQVSDNIDPTRGKFNASGTQTGADSANPRGRRSKIINGAATECVRVAVAGMSSHMTSKSRPWFKLSAPTPELQERFDVRVWMDDVTDIITDKLAKSNFYKAMPVCYTEDMMFGVVAMLMPPSDSEVIRFHPLTAGTYSIGLDGEGRVDALHRNYRRTARQLEKKYGLDKLPVTVKTAFRNNAEQFFNVESMYEKNPDEKPGMGPLGVQAPRYRPWREVVWIQGTDTDNHGVLEVGGHYEAPFVVIRWNPVGDDVYSTCPGIDSLGDIKQLQYLESQKLRLIDMTAEPALSLPDTMRALGGGSLAPRSKTYLPMAQTGAKAEPIYVPAYQALSAVATEIEVVVARIRSAFFYNLFLMMEALGEQTGRTATEIAERKEEKAAVLGPTLEAVTDEGLDPIIIRTFKLCERQGLIPPAPEALDGIALKIEYTSILAQAMKAAGTAGIERLMNFVAMTMKASGDPSKADKFDFDQAIDEYSERVGAPAALTRSDDDVLAIRQGRAKQQQQQQMMATAPAMADAASAIKTLGEAVPQEGSMAEGIAEQMTGAM